MDSRAGALHVLFLAGGNGRAARLAAYLTRLLAGGALQVEAADGAGMDLPLASNDVHPGLVVVIHAPGEPGPLVVRNHGGRVDWHLEMAPATVAPGLAAQLRWYAMRLLSDLGIPHPRAEADAGQCAVPAVVLDLPISMPASTGQRGSPRARAA
jgi:hypothetical protein